MTVVPYNLDAWDGYYAEREFVYDKLAEFNKKIIVLAGIHIMHGHLIYIARKGNMLELN